MYVGAMQVSPLQAVINGATLTYATPKMHHIQRAHSAERHVGSDEVGAQPVLTMWCSPEAA
jgi:hypothetical protein